MQMRSMVVVAGLACVTGYGPVRAQSVPETTGPYAVEMIEEPSLPNHTVYRPLKMAGLKERLPVVAFANGGCANAGNAFREYLYETASHGFLVVANGPIDAHSPLPAGRPAAPGTTTQESSEAARALNEQRMARRQQLANDKSLGPGDAIPSSTRQLYETMDWAKVQNAQAGSPYRDKLDIAAIAVMGQSCGGNQAIDGSSDPRVKTAVILNSGNFHRPFPGVPGFPPPMLPGDPQMLSRVHVPLIYVIGGESDMAYKYSNADFAELTVPVFKANLDVGHDGTLWQPHGGAFAEVATAWLKWQLKGDSAAGQMFNGEPCGLCRKPEWKVERKNWK